MESKKGFYKDVFENCLKSKIILINGIKFEKILEYYEDCEDPFRSGCEGIYFMYFENSQRTRYTRFMFLIQMNTKICSQSRFLWFQIYYITSNKDVIL